MRVETVAVETFSDAGEAILREKFLEVLDHVLGFGGSIINITEDTVRLKRAYVLVPRNVCTDAANPEKWYVL